MSENIENGGEIQQVPTRRRMLMLGAASVSAVVTIRPALASTAASVLTCEIPIEQGTGKWLNDQGQAVQPHSPGSFKPVAKLEGEEVRKARAGQLGAFRGDSREHTQAYLKYINNLNRGQAGFTCFNSIQMPHWSNR